MKAIAAIPHVHVKLSMLGYAVPGWLRNSARTTLNWWKDGAAPDSDVVGEIGPDPIQFVKLISGYFLAKYKFYRIECY
jgi:hypothetical protein